MASVVTETTTTADAAAVAPPRVETAPPPQQPQQQPPPQPYRVTDTTINDIKAFHKSQLSEYDYIVQDAWVSCGGVCAWFWRQNLSRSGRIMMLHGGCCTQQAVA